MIANKKNKYGAVTFLLCAALLLPLIRVSRAAALAEFEEVILTGSVTLTGDMTDADITGGLFEFTISGYGDDFVLQPSPAKVREGGEIAFGGFDFYGEGQYFFEVYQTDKGEDGFTYDTEPVKITVTVTRGEDGDLSHRVAYERGGYQQATLKFRNTYKRPAPPVVKEIEVTTLSSHAVAAPGDTVTLTTTVKNVGNADVVGVRVREYLPEKTLYASHQGDFGKYGAILGREHVTWFIVLLKPGAEVTFSVAFRVNLCVKDGLRLEAAALYEITGDAQKWAVNDPIAPANTTEPVPLTVRRG